MPLYLCLTRAVGMSLYRNINRSIDLNVDSNLHLYDAGSRPVEPSGQLGTSVMWVHDKPVDNGHICFNSQFKDTNFAYLSHHA